MKQPDPYHGQKKETQQIRNITNQKPKSETLTKTALGELSNKRQQKGKTLQRAE